MTDSDSNCIIICDASPDTQSVAIQDNLESIADDCLVQITVGRVSASFLIDSGLSILIIGKSDAEGTGKYSKTDIFEKIYI